MEWNKKYTSIAVYTVITAFVIFMVFAAMWNFDAVASFFGALNSILAPFYIGLGIAYVANPIMKFAQKRIFVFKTTSSRKFALKRGLSIAFAMVALLLILTILVLLIIPQVILSLSDLVSKLSGYISKTVAWLDDFLPDYLFDSSELTIENFVTSVLGYFSTSTIGTELSDLSERLSIISDNLDVIISNSFTIIKEYLPVLFGAFTSFANGIFNIVLGVFFAIYTLMSKEKLIAQIKKLIRSFTGERMYNSTLELGNFANSTFGAYLIGKAIDSIVVGVLMFIVCAIFKIPYAILVSSMVAVTNVIPIIGPFIGAIPGVLIIFIVDPSKVLLFIVINVIIQQIDGNIIVPKILGETTGLSSLWVLFSITVMGGLWGLVGMFISVPIFAVLYMIIKLLVEKRLAHKSLPVDTYEYYSDREIRNFPDHEDNVHSFAARIKKTGEHIKKRALGGKIKGKFKKTPQNEGKQNGEKNNADESK